MISASVGFQYCIVFNTYFLFFFFFLFFTWRGRSSDVQLHYSSWSLCCRSEWRGSFLKPAALRLEWRWKFRRDCSHLWVKNNKRAKKKKKKLVWRTGGLEEDKCEETKMQMDDKWWLYPPKHPVGWKYLHERRTHNVLLPNQLTLSAVRWRPSPTRWLRWG